MSEYILVTTFNRSGYRKYGKKMLESFVKYWPQDQKIVVYAENVIIEIKDPRIEVKNLLEVRHLVDFKFRHNRNLIANGYYPRGAKSKNFKYDAVRFSHKVFAIYDCIKTVPEGIKHVVWLDADTVTHRQIPEDFLAVNFPRKQKIENTEAFYRYGIAYLGRTNQHSECGWMIFHLEDPMVKDFWEAFVNHYKTDSIFRLKEWHDSFVFDEVRLEFEKKGMVNHNITPNFSQGHPFINCILGDYMDHLKGPRKDRGRSKHDERNITTNEVIDWWHK